jgi:hypothetical protein
MSLVFAEYLHNIRNIDLGYKNLALKAFLKMGLLQVNSDINGFTTIESFATGIINFSGIVQLQH